MDGKNCPGPPGRRSRRIFVAFLAATGLVLASSTLGAALKKPEEFKSAIKAQDQKQWQASIDLLQQALAKQPEDGELTRIYGTKYKSYLPHYYVGLALYKQKDCAAALKEWEECLRLGAVQETDEHQALLGYVSECQGRVR